MIPKPRVYRCPYTHVEGGRWDCVHWLVDNGVLLTPYTSWDEAMAAANTAAVLNNLQEVTC